MPSIRSIHVAPVKSLALLKVDSVLSWGASEAGYGDESSKMTSLPSIPGEWVAVEIVEYGTPRDLSGEKDFGKLAAHSVDEREV